MILYVSWGGTGRAASVREAMRRAMAASAGRGLCYLAVLDNEHFADLDDSMLALVTDELRWLLDTQLALTRSQLGADDLAVEVVVRSGDIVDAVAAVLDEKGPAEVLLGAPVPDAGPEALTTLTDALRARIDHEVSVVVPPELDSATVSGEPITP